MNFLRQIVSGPKKRFVEDGYNLDLTYVCPRLIAMSFPASGLETLYRNNIDNVSKMIKNKHNGDYLIINLSGRKYDYSKFQDKVLDYEWEDHHSPPINTLFVICEKIHQFLKKKPENVAIIHCLAGKGRTGTIICCYMLYSGRFETPQEALLYYGKKRFLQEGLGVNQPCQIRYVYYFHQILTEKNVYPTLKYIKQVEFTGRPKFSDDGCRPYVSLINVHTKEKIFSTLKSYSEQQKFTENEQFTLHFEQTQPISGDILMRVKNNGSISNKNMFRVSFNTAFVNKNNVLEFGLSELSPSQILKDEKFPKTFFIRIIFGDFCQCNCNTPFDKKCQGCMLELDKEIQSWSTIYRIISLSTYQLLFIEKNYKTPTSQEQTYLLFGKEPEDVDEILNKEKKAFVENNGVLQQGKSSEENRERLSNFNEYMYQQMCNQKEEKVGSIIQIDQDSDSEIMDNVGINNQVNVSENLNKNQVKQEGNPDDQSLRKRSVMQSNIYDHQLQPDEIVDSFKSSRISRLSNCSNVDQPPATKSDSKLFEQQSQDLLSKKNSLQPNSPEKDKQKLIEQVQKLGQNINLFDEEEERPSHIKNNNTQKKF